VAMKMAEHGLLSAPNMACGEPFNIGITSVQAAVPSVPGGPAIPVPVPMPAVPGLTDGGLG
jgi:hypothetical protein